MKQPHLSPADRLGQLRAEIAQLRIEEKKIEDHLKAEGAGEHEGLYFRAVVSVAKRVSVAWKDVAEKLNPSHQLIAAHSTESEVVSIRVSAKLTDKLAA